MHESSTIVKPDGLAVLVLLKCPTKKKRKPLWMAWKEKTFRVDPSGAMKASLASVADLIST